MSREIECPSKAWDRHCEDEERAAFPSDEELLEQLDAYGHLTYVIGWSDEWSDDKICICPTVWRRGKPVEKPGFEAGLCVKCTGREDRGDWLACFDFIVHTDSDGMTKVAYHVVVNSDSSGFIDEVESDVVVAKGPPFNLPSRYLDIGLDQDVSWTDEEVKDAVACNKKWNEDLAAAIKEETRDDG